ncbi:hypothetical protein AQJ64_30320 [Streptomyces griseoruber]|uniref:Uncharacterized protein n=1 Tax=Streptomyces griseoruber TaxID=1943 RepID=A0A101SRM0_9ACTN|nr:hypothetical protein AQJ64_30320 [Streptomyces griseoruber]
MPQPYGLDVVHVQVAQVAQVAQGGQASTRRVGLGRSLGHGEGRLPRGGQCLADRMCREPAHVLLAQAALLAPERDEILQAYRPVDQSGTGCLGGEQLSQQGRDHCRRQSSAEYRRLHPPPPSSSANGVLGWSLALLPGR